MSEFIVPAITPRIRHLASGSEEARRVFPFPFPSASAGDIAVHRDGTLLDGGYAIAFAGDRQGGTITLDAAVPEGAEIVILRSTVIERATDFVENGAFRASTLNLELDRLTMIAQELDLAGRAGLHRDPSEVGPDLVLPAPPVRANGLLGFSADGRALAVLSVESLRGEKGETGPQGPAGDMSGANNLSELTDPATARANLDVASRAELDDGLAAVDAAIRQVDLNLALNTLQDAIEAGWTALGMVEGFVDAFTDQSGVSRSYSFAGGNSVLAGIVPTIPGSPYGAATADRATDGNTASYYQHGTAVDSGLNVDFELNEPAALDRLRLWHGGAEATPSGFRVFSSDDGSTWVAEAGDLAFDSVANNTWGNIAWTPSGEHLHWRFQTIGVRNTSNGVRPLLYELQALPQDGFSINASYDAAGDFYTNTGLYSGETPVGDLTAVGGLSALFDGAVDVGAKAYTNANVKIGLDFGGSASSPAINRIEFQCAPGLKIDSGVGAQTITTCDLYGSADGSFGSDTLLESFGPLVNDQDAQNFVLDVTADTTGYQMLYLLLSHDGGAETQLVEVRFLQNMPMTLVSTAALADEEPVAARAVMLIEPLEAITLDTDLVCEVSRDDGESWTALALSREVIFESGLELLAGAETLLAMQPSGTAIRIRLQTPTSRRIRVKGWAMQWR